MLFHEGVGLLGPGRLERRGGSGSADSVLILMPSRFGWGPVRAGVMQPVLRTPASGRSLILLSPRQYQQNQKGRRNKCRGEPPCEDTPVLSTRHVAAEQGENEGGHDGNDQPGCHYEPLIGLGIMPSLNIADLGRSSEVHRCSLDTIAISNRGACLR